MNEKKFLDELNLRIEVAEERYTGNLNYLDEDARLWKSKRDVLEYALESYMKFRDEPEKFVSDVNSYIDWVDENRVEALALNMRGEAVHWLTKWSARQSQTIPLPHRKKRL